MGNTPEQRSAPPAARIDRDSMMAALGKFKAGGMRDDDLVDPKDPHEGSVVNDDDDHGDEPEPRARPTRPNAEPDDAAEEPGPDADADDDADGPPSDDELDDGEDLDVDDDGDDADAGDQPAKVPDPELERRSAQLRRQEQRVRSELGQAKAELQRERAIMQREREELRSEREELARYKAARSRAKYDPAGVLAELGLGEDDFGPAARQIYARTKEAAADPKNREAADRLMQEREHRDSLAQTQRELKELREEIQRRDHASRVDAEVKRYVAGLVSSVPKVTDAPLVARALKRNPERWERRLGEVALEMAQQTGELPTPKRVIRELERRRREELEDARGDVEVLGQRQAPAARVGSSAPPARVEQRQGQDSQPVISSTPPRPLDLEARKDSVIASLAEARKRRIVK